MRILFLDGWRATPGGIKPTLLASRGHEVVNPKLDDDDFENAVRIAQRAFDTHLPELVVGISRGGAVAMNLATASVPLLLMCPGWKRWGTATTVKAGTVILHAVNDDVVPFAHSEELRRNSDLPVTALIVAGADHWLNDPASLHKLVEECERSLR